VDLKILRTIQLLLTFYKSFFLVNSLITLTCMGLFREYGISIFAALFWLKLSTLAIVFYYIRSYKNKEFYYYQSLGLSRTFLWLTTLSFDLCLYFFLLYLIYKMSL
jgi:hypothetical protein